MKLISMEHRISEDVSCTVVDSIVSPLKVSAHGCEIFPLRVDNQEWAKSFLLSSSASKSTPRLLHWLKTGFSSLKMTITQANRERSRFEMDRRSAR